MNAAFASPVASLPSNQTSPEPALPLAGAIARPPKPPVCPEDLSPARGWTKFFARDCAAAIAKIPRDTRPAAPLRNFYLLTADMASTMPNVQLPLEFEYGDCVLQVLLAASFKHVPHEQATWMDIWGPSRLILQQCVNTQNTGGIVTNIGQTERLDLVIYSKRSLFAHTRRLRGSPDPVAVDIAEIEYLQLLGIIPRLDVVAEEGETEGDGDGGTGAVSTA
ncbi:MAG: hypothetical protein LQ344_005347 [Seirophora lacunosa]|nr:MAG: hypothetical protein LQ344_005347 [Seirophora lacunosa]